MVVLLLVILLIAIDRNPIGVWLQEKERVKTFTKEVEIIGPVRYEGVYYTKETRMDLNGLVRLGGGLKTGYKFFPGMEKTYIITNNISIDMSAYTFYNKRNRYVRTFRK